MKKNQINHSLPDNTRLAILTVGMGAVSTTLFAGVRAVVRNQGVPVGSLTQLGKMGEAVLLKEALALVPLKNLVFGGWDIFSDDAYQSAIKADVISAETLRLVSSDLKKIKPFPAISDPQYLKALKGSHTKKQKNKFEQVKAVRADIRSFLKKNRCQQGVVVICSSTESDRSSQLSLKSVDDFDRALKKNHKAITPSMIYTYAAFLEGCPVANATPNNIGSVDFLELVSRQNKMPYAGCDLKTGQTLMKSILAPGLKARMLGVEGWFSTNILGNRDGKVLHDPLAFRAKERSKKEVLRQIFSAEEYPELYKNLSHLININYYPPRGDNKEGWDNIDIFGWLNYKMQIKINFLCRDSILAAPLVLDLALLLDWARREGKSGLQEWLGFYFKSPFAKSSEKVEHDLFVQFAALKKALKTS